MKVPVWLLLFFTPLVTYAQQQWVIQQHIGLREGLPQNSVRDLYYDKYGYLWIATEGGLARWDGMHIKTITRRDAPDIFESGRISFINEDQDGRAIVAPESYPRKFAALTGPFSYSALPDDQKRYLGQIQYKLMDITALYQRAKDKGWNRLIPELDKMNITPFSEDGKTGALVFDNSVIWYDGKQVSLAPLNGDVKTFTSKFFYLDGHLFYINDHKGLHQITQYGKDELIRSGSLFRLLDTMSLEQRKVVSIFQFQGSTLFYATNQLFILKQRNGIPEITLLADRLDINNIASAIYNERTEQLILGTFSDGLYILRNNKFDVLKQMGEDKADPGYNIFYSLSHFSRDRLITNKGILSLARREFNTLPLVQNGAISAVQQQVVLQYGEYLTLIDTLLRKTPLFPLQYTACGMQSLNDTALLTLTPAALFRYDLHAHRLDTLMDQYRQSEPFTCMLMTGDQTLLIGYWRGMIRYTINTRKRETIPVFSQNNIRVLYRGRDGLIWVGTFGDGFYSWDQRSAPVHYPVDQHHNLDVINNFVEDSLGYMWITTNNGLFRYDQRDLQQYREGNKDKLFYNYLDETDGLPVNEFNHGSPGAIVTTDGRLAFASMRGVVTVAPWELHFRNPLLRPFIDRITIDTTIISPAQQSRIVIAPGPQQVQFELSTPYAGNPHELQFYYRLSGSDKHWLPVPEDGKILFNRLGKGDYDLEFRLVRSGGDNYTAISFRVLPRWFERTAVRLSLVVLLILLAVLGYLYGTRVLRRQKQRLEVLVGERTRDLDGTIEQLTDTVERLRSSEEELYRNNKQRERLSAIAVHDIQSPLKFLSGIADQLYRKINVGQTQQLDELAFELRNAAMEITTFSNDYLNWLKSSQANVQKQKTQVDVKELVRAICKLFAELAKHKGTSLRYEVQEGLQIYTIRDYLGIVIRNLVDNAHKYTHNGAILIEARTTDQGKIIRVSDTGKGLLPEQINLLLGKTGVVASEGLGLRIIYDLMEQCGGTIAAENKPGEGTVITLTF